MLQMLQYQVVFMPNLSRARTCFFQSQIQFLSRLSSSAGGLALPGKANPIASEIDAIVFAVNMPPHDPALGHATFFNVF